MDLGSVNADIEKVLGDGNAKTVKKLADHAFVLLARAVFKPTIAIPVAHYFSTSLSGAVSMHPCHNIFCVHACVCALQMHHNNFSMQGRKSFP